MKPALIYYVAASLDGYITRPDGALDWLQEVEGATGDRNYPSFYDSIDGLLMGNATYDRLNGSDGWPYPGKPCRVLARNPLESAPCGVEGSHCTPTMALEDLAACGCKRVWLVGGGSLAGNCLAAGLLDELVVNLIPHLLGAGTQLFATSLECRLRLHKQRHFGSGLVQLHYQVLPEAA